LGRSAAIAADAAGAAARRIALRTLLAVGEGPRRRIGGIKLATTLISMWVSNTATAIMMLPIGQSVIELVTRGAAPAERERLAVALLLAIACSASISSMTTLIGTPPNHCWRPACAPITASASANGCWSACRWQCSCWASPGGG